MEKTFEIKITGGGSKSEIIEALQGVIQSIESMDEDRTEHEWEGATLMTEITEE